jgi:hypothetical protein
MGEAENIENLEQELNNAAKVLEGVEKEVSTVVTKTAEEIAAEAEAARIAAEALAKGKDGEALEDDLSQGTRSHIGRIVARQVKERTKPIEDMLAEIKGSIDFIKGQKVEPVISVKEEDEVVLSEYPTAEEIKAYNEQERKKTLSLIDQREAEKSNKQKADSEKYVKEYARLLKESVDPEEDADLYKLLTDEKDLTYNQVYKNDPKEDFLINFRAANKSIRNKANGTVTKTTVANKTSGIPTGVNIPSNAKAATKIVDTSKWSMEEQQLAAHFSAEELAELDILR